VIIIAPWVNPKWLCFVISNLTFLVNASRVRNLQFTEPELIQHPRYPRKGWIGVDLDGTLAKNVFTTNELGIGPPVPYMLKRVRHWIDSGRKVKIFTSRAGDHMEEERIQQWCLLHGLPKLEITNRKDHRMIALWDDRAVGVVKNLGIPILPASMTLWLRFRLGLSILFGGRPSMKINDFYLLGNSDAAMKSSSTFLEL
jgi:hypothetical protein